MPGYGPKVQRNAPAPQAPRYTLIGAATIADETDERWANGVRLYGYPTELPDLFDQCGDSTQSAAKSDGGTWTNPTFDAFTVSTGIKCTAAGMGPVGELVQRARQVFTAREAFAVEREFWTGTLLPTNPYLASAAATVVSSGSSSVTPVEGLALLERAIANTGSMGFIHATVEVATYWASLNLLFDDGPAAKLRTRLGNIVVPGSGYPGTPPAGGATATGSAGEQFAFATGPVEVRRSNPFAMPESPAEALDRVNNTIVWRIERLYQVGWDTALQAAVKIDRLP